MHSSSKSRKKIINILYANTFNAPLEKIKLSEGMNLFSLNLFSFPFFYTGVAFMATGVVSGNSQMAVGGHFSPLF